MGPDVENLNNEALDIPEFLRRPSGDLHTINVLDHGLVRLVEHMGSDLSIVRAARVSHDAAWRAGDDKGSDARLINYLMTNKHTTPFEMVEFCFEVKLPIFVARQWVRHRTANINEVSARYTELPADFYIPRAEDIGVQHAHNKQARDTGELGDMLPEEVAQRVMEISRLKRHSEAQYELYQELIESGWPRELARMTLPVNIYTHWFWKIDLHNLFHFLRLRLHSHAQMEIRVYAEAMLELIRPVAPVAVAAFEKTLQEN